MMAVLTQIRLIRKVRNRLSDEEIEDELGRAETTALTGLKEARNAIKQIRTNTTQDKGISTALQELVERFSSRTSAQYKLHIDARVVHQEDDRGETVYRIVEEVLRNIEKHAQASNVEVSLNQLDLSNGKNDTMPEFKLTIADDGIGFDTERVDSGHYGLIGIREQAELIDGKLIIDSSHGSGSKISLIYSAYQT